MFHQLWKAGDTAHLNLNTYAGQAWVGIRTPLGHPGQPQQYQHQTPNYHQYSQPSPNQRSPSYFCRKQRRQAAKAAEETTTNQEETTAEEADHAEKHLNNLNSETKNPTLTTEEVEKMIESNIEQTNIIIDKTAKPNNEETITEEPTNTTKTNFSVKSAHSNVNTRRVSRHI